MALSLSDIIFQKFEYVIDSFSIQSAGKTYKMETIQLTDLYIERDYDHDHLPVVMIRVVISDELYHTICTNPTNTTFTIVIKSQIDVGNKIKNSGSIYISDKFVPLGKDGTPFQSKQLYDQIKTKSTAGSNSTLTNFTNVRTFIIGRKTDLISTKKITNVVLSSSNMLDAVSVVLSQAGASKVLISPLDNNTSYSELILLPQPTIAQLKYLNSFYGFYKEGAQIFFDLWATYILRNSAKCTAYKSNEVRTVYFCIYDSSNAKAASMGSKSYINEKSAYIAVNGVNFHVEDLSTTSNEYIGTNSVVINNDGKVSQATSGKGTTYNVLSVRNHNNCYTSEISARIKELSCVVTISVMSFDLSLITPNKTYKILSSDTSVANKVTGSFRLVSIKTVFTKDGDVFIPTSVIMLKRTDA